MKVYEEGIIFERTVFKFKRLNKRTNISFRILNILSIIYCHFLYLMIDVFDTIATTLRKQNTPEYLQDK